MANLKDKYKDVIDRAGALGIKGLDVREEGGKLVVKGEAAYQYDKDRVWDAIKKQSGWESEVSANLTVADTSIFGVHVVQSGETLSKIAKSAYDNAGKYMKIFEANKDQLSNPDVIKPGQKLKLPNP